jgi:hypothetical protein
MFLDWIAASGRERGFIWGEGSGYGFYWGISVNCMVFWPLFWVGLAVYWLVIGLVAAIEPGLPVWGRAVAGHGRRMSGF